MPCLIIMKVCFWLPCPLSLNVLSPKMRPLFNLAAV
uniref:Uncharacterized protein n=1 Tax=Anguilla anguilla TaxID=7936 RepID=A0A0E9PPX4_ANGAN